MSNRIVEYLPEEEYVPKCLDCFSVLAITEVGICGFCHKLICFSCYTKNHDHAKCTNRVDWSNGN